MDELNPPFGIDMVLHKKMPIGSGLGSSGASCAAAVYAVNALLTNPLPKQDLLRFAVEGERLAAGAPHADNVAPSLLGGICLIQSHKTLDVVKIPHKNIFYWVIAHPHLMIATEMARGILPKTLSLPDTTEQLGALGGLLIGLVTGNSYLLSKSIKDNIAEPVRARLIPGFDEIRYAALKAGALGFSISGSGPSVFAVTTSLAIAKQTAISMTKAFKRHANVKCDIYISKVNQSGTKLIGS